MESEFYDLLVSYGLDPNKFTQEQINAPAFRKAAHRAGVKQYFRQERIDSSPVETPQSTNVRSIWYNEEDDTLYIEFDNRRGKGDSVRLYQYDELRSHGFDALQIFGELVSSPSPGSVVWDRLRRSGAPFFRVA